MHEIELLPQGIKSPVDLDCRLGHGTYYTLEHFPVIRIIKKFRRGYEVVDLETTPLGQLKISIGSEENRTVHSVSRRLIELIRNLTIAQPKILSLAPWINQRALDIVDTAGFKDWLHAYNYFIRQPWLNQFEYPMAYCLFAYQSRQSDEEILPCITSAIVSRYFENAPVGQSTRKLLSRIEFDVRSVAHEFGRVCCFVRANNRRLAHIFGLAKEFKLSKLFALADLLEGNRDLMVGDLLLADILKNGLNRRDRNLLLDTHSMAMQVGSRMDAQNMLLSAKSMVDIGRLHDSLSYTSRNETLLEDLKGQRFPEPRFKNDKHFSHIATPEELFAIATQFRNCAFSFVKSNLAGNVEHYIYLNPVSGEKCLAQVRQHESRLDSYWEEYLFEDDEDGNRENDSNGNEECNRDEDVNGDNGLRKDRISDDDGKADRGAYVYPYANAEADEEENKPACTQFFGPYNMEPSATALEHLDGWCLKSGIARRDRHP